MGVRAALEHRAAFTYRAELGHGLIEHEIDHVFVGQWTGKPNPNPAEVVEWKWVNAGALRRDLEANPGEYTAWLAFVLERAGF